MALSTCQSCGISLTSGGQFCSMCVPRTRMQNQVAVNTTPKMEISNIVDTTLDWRFDVEPGRVRRPQEEWIWYTVVAHAMAAKQFIVLEVVAKIVGDQDDVAVVGNSLLLRLLDNGTGPILERQLNLLTIDERQASAELTMRIARLERMMNVLVEQDSAAGEALRRLGGAKIEHDTLTKLRKPALFERHHTIHMRAVVTDPFEVQKTVAVRVSLVGLKKYEVT